ncbi:DEAD/DEAH box helicase [Pectobacterium versatile]|uniref:DEAD/DEAH box helicase n=1 Tax=Pectobacterium versatile TaxID=2488639 RepID=UPI00386C9D75
MTNVYTQAVLHKDFINVFDALLENFFVMRRGGVYQSEFLCEDKIRKAVWLASIAALGSENEKNQASSFGTLLHLYNPKSELFKKSCYILQSRVGNIVTTNHLPHIFENEVYKTDFGLLMNFELAGKRSSLFKEFSDNSKIYFTEFQKRIWESLINYNNIAISAPTSSGKSFIIKKYIIERIFNNTIKKCIYIVPSKALINQVSNEFSKELMDKVTVLTTYRDLDESSKKIIFVLTPERCLRLLQEKPELDPDVVFFDEVQNVEDDSRGSIYENILYRMTRKWFFTQFIMAGPFIENIKQALNKITDINIIEEKTLSTPVLQIKVALTVSPRSKSVDYKIISPTGMILSKQLNIKKGLYSKLTSQRGEALSHIVSLFKNDEQNIIYSPKKNLAENWAVKISEGKSLDFEVDENRLKSLNDFLSVEVHPSYSLIRTLRKGVAFHHGGLLEVARMEVEDLFSQGVINNIVCTSTLLQGVNLPADRIIILSPKVGNYELSQFDFMNLIGRAGRISSSMYGEIFCFDVKDEEWGEEKILGAENKEVKSVVLKKIDENKDKILDYIDLDREKVIEQGGDIKILNFIHYLRSQYIVDTTHFKKIISNSILTDTEKTLLESRLGKLKDNIIIPDNLLSKSQFIDPIEQDTLFRKIYTEGVEKWIINKFPGSKDGIDSEFSPFERMSYYSQYRSIIQRLDEISGIEDEVNKGDGNSFKKLKFYVSYKKLANDSNKWMQGKKYSFFIENTLKKQYIEKGKEINDKTVDAVTNFVTIHINTNLNFILVKYLTLWSNIVSHFLTDKQKEKFAFVLNLPSMLEMGSYSPTVLEIMSYGINRSTAIEIDKLYKSNMPIEIFLKNLKLEKLPPLHRKYLERAGFGVN